MRSKIAIAAAALLLFTESAQAAAAPVQQSPTGYSANGTATARPERRLGQAPAASLRALVTGSFVDAAGKRYDAAGSGDVTQSPGTLQYSVSLRGYPYTPPLDIIDFGTLSGLGLVEDGRFQIHGVINAKGYILDVSGVIDHGVIRGEFHLMGNGGEGQGDFTAL